MTQIKQEVDENRKKIVKLTEQIEDGTKRATVARTAITTLSSRMSTLDASAKTLKGADLAKIKAAQEKVEAELENAKNSLSISEA